ncbi:hypothetical protein HMPREF9534_02235 [Escherichia coli MS 69-1]|nr:hypothetical protein HMPREF9534_02235 [Escherichia coli MS 69-1]ESD82353.1 hypothetical protein HMPREF1611_03493 [Escherichia coli 908573]
MRYPYFTKRLAADQSVTTNRSKQPWQHLIRTGTVMAVEQNNFRHLVAIDLVFPAQTQHVFCMLTFTHITNTGLAGKKRMKSFTLEVIEQGNGGNIGIAFAA